MGEGGEVITKAFAEFFAENCGDEPPDAEAMSQIIDDAESEGVKVPTLEEAMVAFGEDDVVVEEDEDEDEDEESEDEDEDEDEESEDEDEDEESEDEAGEAGEED
jgi:hypothetical protein